MNLYVEVEILTEACLASGGSSGVGDVSTTTELDADGMPVLRGRTLKGLLVEEAAMILQMAGAPERLVHAAGALFGDPGRHGTAGLVTFADGSVPPAVREAFVKYGWSSRALTSIRRQTAIDPSTGAARAGSLRATRLLRAGVVLICPLRLSREVTPIERAFLAACVVSLRRLGLHRNEGWGRARCRLHDDGGTDRTREWVAALDSAPIIEPVTSPAAVASSQTSASCQRTVVELDIELERPVVLSDRASGNWITTTLAYLPGSALLGACAARWLAANRCDDPSLDNRFRRLFLDGTVRWLNAYPLDDQARVLPAPRSWRTDNTDPDAPSVQILDLTHEDSQEHLEVDEHVWSPLPAATFGLTSAERIRLVRSRTTPRLHHERDRAAGRSRDGELFVLDALDAGQQFRSAVLCESATEAEIIRDVLHGAVLELGRSRTATYGGGARILNVRVSSGDSWSEAESAESPHVLVLTSDYLGRNTRGTPDPTALLGELELRLGLDPGDLGPSRLYTGHRVVHGNVGRWQMPRPPAPAVAAGSVIALPADVSVKIDRGKLKDLVWHGVGERRAEGFGRVLCQAPRERAVGRADKVTGRVRPAAIPIPSSPEHDRLLAQARRWVGLHAVQPAMIEDATALGLTLRRHVAPSLVARIRQEVRGASSFAAVRAFLHSLARKPAGKALANVIEGRSFDLGVLSHCTSWQDKFRHALPRGVTMDDLEKDAWPLQQIWLDTLLERWRRAVQSGQETA